LYKRETKVLLSKGQDGAEPQAKAKLQGAAALPRLPKSPLWFWTPAEQGLERCQRWDGLAGYSRDGQQQT